MTNETKKDLKLINVIRKSLQSDALVIPNFIDNSIINHRFCYESGTSVINKFVPLFSDKVLTIRQVKSIFNNINIDISDMSCLDAGITLMYYSWFLELLTAYKQLCIDNELWEACQNIKNLEDLIIQ